VQAHLAGVHLGEKVPAKVWKKKQRARYQREKENSGDTAPPDAIGDDAAITLAQAVEPGLEFVVDEAEDI
jgi:hypothetical protein